jgi:hypothetical protein
MSLSSQILTSYSNFVESKLTRQVLLSDSSTLRTAAISRNMPTVIRRPKSADEK